MAVNKMTEIYDYLLKNIEDNENLFFYDIEYDKKTGRLQKVAYKLIATRKKPFYNDIVVQKCERKFDSSELVVLNPDTKDISKRVCYELNPEVSGKKKYVAYLDFLNQQLQYKSLFKHATFTNLFFNGYEYVNEPL